MASETMLWDGTTMQWSAVDMAWYVGGQTSAELSTASSFSAAAAGNLPRRRHLTGAVGNTPLTVSITPAANSWLIASISVRRNGTSAANTPTCVDNGGNTWTLIANGVSTGSNSIRLSLYKTQVGASPGTFNVTIASTSATSVGVNIEEFSGASPDFSNISPVNIATQPIATLPVAPLLTSLVLGSYACNGGTAITIPSGYTAIALHAPAGQQLEICDDQTTTRTAGWTDANAEACGCLVEIRVLSESRSGANVTLASSFSADGDGGVPRRRQLAGGVGTVSAAAAITPAANSWLIATVVVRRNGTSAANTPTCVDNGGNTWTLIANGVQTTSNSLRLALFKVQAKVSPGTFTVTAASTSATAMALSIVEFTEATPDLSNVSLVGIDAAGDPQPRLPANPLPTSIVLASFGCIGTNAITLPDGYSQIDQQSPTGALLNTSWERTDDFDAAWFSTNSESAASLLEVKILLPEGHGSSASPTIPATFFARVIVGKAGRGAVITTNESFGYLLDADGNSVLDADGNRIVVGNGIFLTDLKGTFYARGTAGRGEANGASFTTPSSFTARANGGQTGRAGPGQSASFTATPATPHTAGAVGQLSSTGSAVTAGGEGSSGGLAQAASFVVVAGPQRVTSGSTSIPASFAVLANGGAQSRSEINQTSSLAAATAPQHASDTNVQLSSAGAAAAAGGEGSTVSQIQPGSFVAAVANGSEQAASTNLIEMVSQASAMAGRQANASLTQAVSFFAKGRATASEELNSGANVTLAPSFASFAIAGAQAGASFDQASGTSAAPAHDHIGNASSPVPSYATADARGTAGSAISVTQGQSFAANGGVSFSQGGGIAAQTVQSSFIIAVDNTRAAGGMLTTTDTSAARAAAARQGWCSFSQTGAAYADADTACATSGGLTASLTFGAALGDVARAYVQILSADAMVLSVADVVCTVD